MLSFYYVVIASQQTWLVISNRLFFQCFVESKVERGSRGTLLILDMLLLILDKGMNSHDFSILLA